MNSNSNESRRERKRQFRQAMERFKESSLTIPSPGKPIEGSITGVFEDKKDGQERAIIMHRPTRDISLLRNSVSRAFKGYQWKLVEQKIPARGTALNGADAFLDAHGGVGTVGGWLVDPNSGERYGFSNNHVIASLGGAPVGSAVFQASNRIGGLRAFIQLDQRVWNTADLALFTLDSGQAAQWTHPSPKGSHGAYPGLRVYKHGYSTKATEGVVTSSNGALLVELAGVGFWFNGVISIQGHHGAFSEGGDSGALVMTKEGHNATAILFAKDMYSGHSYAFPIGAAYPLFRNLNYHI